MEQTEIIVKGVVKNRLGIGLKDITLDDEFTTDLGADSIHIVEMIMAIEDKFDIEIRDEDMDKLTTVRKLVEYILKNT